MTMHVSLPPKSLKQPPTDLQQSTPQEQRTLGPWPVPLTSLGLWLAHLTHPYPYFLLSTSLPVQKPQPHSQPPLSRWPRICTEGFLFSPRNHRLVVAYMPSLYKLEKDVHLSGWIKKGCLSEPKRQSSHFCISNPNQPSWQGPFIECTTCSTVPENGFYPRRRQGHPILGLS